MGPVALAQEGEKRSPKNENNTPVRIEDLLEIVSASR